MRSLLLPGFIAFVFCVVLTPVCRDIFLRLGIVDHPDNGRKRHGRPIPRVGGIPIVISCAAALGISILLSMGGRDLVRQGLPLAWRLLPAAALVFAVGLLDDLIGLKAWQKLPGQIAAAGLAYWAGIHIQSIAGYQMPHWWNVPLTILWLVSCTNAFNLIDGVDGLAAGVGLFATATTLIAALTQGNMQLAYATVPLVGCLLGFLRYNFNPATIFLGDSGSLLIGFLLGCYGVLWSQKSATLLGLTAPLMALAIPLLDTLIAIGRRFLRGQPIFNGDRGHIHHRLLDRGLTPRRVALILYSVCGLAAAFSLLQQVAQRQFGGFVVVIFCVMAWIGIQHLGYLEFGTAGRLLLDGAFHRLLMSQLTLRDFQQTLAAAATPEACWAALRDTAGRYGFCDVELWLAGRYYSERLVDGEPQRAWTVDIPLSKSDSVKLTLEFESDVQPAVVAPFAAAIWSILGPKLEALQSALPVSEFPETLPVKPGMARSAEAGTD